MSMHTLSEIKRASIIKLGDNRSIMLINKTTDTVTVWGNCIFHPQDRIEIKNVPWDGLLAWLNGAMIQDALPEISVDDREFLISGTGPTFWKAYEGSDDPDPDQVLDAGTLMAIGNPSPIDN